MEKKTSPLVVCVLAVSPELPVPYRTEEEQERLMELYRYLHSRLHHPTRPLRSIYRCTNTENLLGWVRTHASHAHTHAPHVNMGRIKGSVCFLTIIIIQYHKSASDAPPTRFD